MKLRISHPTIRGLTVPLDPRGLVVGREGGHADLEMNWDRRVSRRHVRFWLEGENVWFEDLGSRNGTWLGTTRLLGAHPLPEGAPLTVGDTTFTLLAREELEPSQVVTGDLERVVEATPAPPLGSLETAIFPALAEDDGTVELPDLGLEGIFGPPDVATIPAAETMRRPAPPVIVPTPTPQVIIPPPPRTGLPPLSRHEQGPGDTPVAAASPPPPLRAAPPPTAAEIARDKEKEVVRVHPRFLAEKKVLVSASGRGELLPLWTENISKGGLFVRSDTPPARGTVLDVVIHTPDGEIELSAEVVHVVEPRMATAGMAAGVGLQFRNLSAPTRDALHRYVDGLAEKLEIVHPPDAPAAQPMAKADVDKGLARARDLIGRFEANDIYGALAVKPTASSEEIAQKVNELKTTFAALEREASPPQLARLTAAEKLLDRAMHLMSNAERRLEYDFRQGEVRADQRMELARQHKGPSISELRGVWHRAMPDRLEKALVLVREAVAAKKDRDLVKAIKLGRAALDLDPFHEELRRTVDAWQLAEGIPPSKS